MSKFEGFIILLVSIMISIAIVGASTSAAKDRSFYVYKFETKENISVTENTITKHFPIAPSEDGCDMMGICKVNGKTMLSPKKYGG